MKIKEILDELKMCRDLTTFDPMTGEQNYRPDYVHTAEAMNKAIKIVEWYRDFFGADEYSDD